jgi:type I restriction enzyme M protein
MKTPKSNKQQQNKAFITQDYKMQLLHPHTSGSDPLGRYYTNGIVGRTLVREMNLENPNLVVDLGTGDGSLSAEAAQIWRSAKFITVDIDKNVSEANNNRLKHTSSIHYTSDVLNSKLHDRIGLTLGSVDGAVCNPPYIRPRWRKDFGDILEDAGLSGILASMKDVSADVLFIAQNLRFLRNSGRLGLILPDGIIAGEKYLKLREILLNEHRVERVIELPRRIFRKTDAKAHIVILTKNGQSNETIPVERLDENGLLSKRILVPIVNAIHRVDYSYLESQQPSKSASRIILGEVCEELTRGQLSSVQVRNSKVNIFHSTDFPEIINEVCPNIPNEFIIKGSQSNNLKTTVAQAGDILLCRVGRNLEKKICYVPKGKVALSDCVYKLRINSKYRKKVMKFLCTATGQERLKALTHGVGAKYFSKSDLLRFVVDTKNESNLLTLRDDLK